ncbi:MAG: glycosyltransferase [Polyangiaceae bacterium]
MISKMPRILHLSFDGVLQPLGYAQVLRPTLKLAARGFEYEIASLERQQDLADSERLHRVEAELAAQGVQWKFDVYDESGGGKAVLTNLVRGAQLAAASAARGTKVLHARGYQPAAIAFALRRMIGLPYVFDTRGFWIDERAEEGRWFNTPSRLDLARRLEALLFHSAARVVCLAEPGARDIQDGTHTGRAPTSEVAVIPTAVDYAEFADSSSALVPSDVRDALGNSLVIGFVGSLNDSYRVDESIELFRRLRDLRPDAKLLGLTRQTDELSSRLDRAGVRDWAVVRSVPHEHMPSWLRLIDWGLLLLKTSRAKRASMPTKLAEFFAAGIRPVQFGCNDEVSAWVRNAGTGLVLPDLSKESLARAAKKIAEGGRSEALTQQGILATREHFDLKAAADAYARVLGPLIASRT